jgi:Ca2+-transporting ATPase
MGFKGTFITNGRAIGYVVSTGMNTELGRIAKMIQTDEVQTPLQKRLTVFGRKLTSVILLICAIVFFLGWWRGEKVLEVLLTSISLAVAAIPEALPALITIVLAIGAKRLVLNNALVRNLPAVETLGSVTYICSDKTGTLTLNQMTVQEVIVFSNVNNSPLLGENSHLLTAIALNNDVVKTENGAFMGDSTEIALAQYALSLHKDRFELEQLYPRIAEIPFDSTRKCMTTIHQTDRGQFAITKGAVDVLLNKLSPVFHKHIPEYESVLNEMASKGYRILGYAMKPLSSEQSIYSSSIVECDLQLIGLLGLMDPARK